MKPYHQTIDKATAAFYAAAEALSRYRKRERQAICIAASRRQWPHLPQSLLLIAITILNEGYGSNKQLIPPMAQILWNHGYGWEHWSRSIGFVLSRMARGN